MIAYVITDTNNMVIEAGRSGTLPSGATAVAGYVGPVSALARMWMSNGTLVARPAAPVVSQTGSQITIADLVSGTKVEVIDIEGDEVMLAITTTDALSTEVIQFSNPGAYQISVVPPLPALQKNIEVTI